VRDFGAVGDGIARPAAANHRATGQALRAASSGSRHQQIDGEDTADWLGFQEAIRTLHDGGGTVHVPNGHYILRRPIVLRDGIRISGESRSGVVLDNVLPQLTAAEHGYQGYFRTTLFGIGATHPVMVNPRRKSSLTSYSVAGGAAAGATRLTLTDAEGARALPPGTFVLLHSVDKRQALRDNRIPVYAQFNRIVAAHPGSGVVELADPLRRTYAAALLGRLGTGSWPALRQPWEMVGDVVIENFTGRGGAITAGSGLFGGRIENFDFAGRRGLVTNGLVNTVVRNGTIRCRERAIEIKGFSSNTEIADIASIYEGAGEATGGGRNPENIPLLSIGEASDGIVLRRCSFKENEAYPSPTKMVLIGYDTVLEQVHYEAMTKGTILDDRSEAGDTTHRVLDVTLVALTPQVSRFVRIASSSGRAGPTVHYENLRCEGRVSAEEAQILVKSTAGGIIRGLSFDQPGYGVGGPEAGKIKVL
jgi:hypothetical protein